MQGVRSQEFLSQADAELEAEIQLAYELGLKASSPDLARAAFAAMAGAIAQRSPERIAQMERERGLRA
jgi:hypothetical protein